VSIGDSYPGSPANAPVNQFGTPISMPGATAAHAFTSDAGWQSSTPLGGAAKSSAARSLVPIAILLVALVAGGVALRHYVFPDLSKSVTLPAVAAGLSQGNGSTSGVTLQTKDPKGHAQAVSVYADDSTRPTQLAMIIAVRGKPQNLDVPSAVATTTTGKYTCTAELTGAELMQAAPQAQQSLARAGMSSGAVCWRASRHFTAMGVAFVSAGSAASLASQAAQAGWDAR
jgi:hypothetical protein